MTREVEVTEMKGATAEYISLVHRGANRIGFRVLKHDKQENVMLNLNTLGQSVARALKGEVQPEKTGPLVVGIATKAEGEQLEVVKKSLVDNGFKADTVETLEDGTTMFRQEEGELDGLSLVRLSDNTVLVVKGFSPYGEDVTNDFLANVKANGFYNSLYSATDAFRSSLYNLLYDSSSPTEASSAAKKLFSDFESYVSGLISDLPTKAFKMDADVTSALAKAVKADEPAEAPNVEAAAEEPKPAAEGSADADADAPTDAPVVEAAPEEEPKPAEAPKTDAGLEQVLKAIQDLSGKVGELASSQEEIGKVQKQLGERVDEVARKSEHALKAVGSTVIGAPSGEDTPQGAEVVKKADSDPRTGCFDTAFINR